eukprot:2195883-Amphidinium_carterae.1
MHCCDSRIALGVQWCRDDSAAQESLSLPAKLREAAVCAAVRQWSKTYVEYDSLEPPKTPTD